MISDKQLKANQENAKLGGIKTREGKKVSKFNALTHGILRQSLSEYEEGFNTSILDDLLILYKPEGVIEQILVERIAIYYLKLYRVQRAEAEYVKSKLNPHKVRSQLDITIEGLEDNQVINEGYIPKITDENIQGLTDIYARYETTLENRLYRALHELEWVRLAKTGKSV